MVRLGRRRPDNDKGLVHPGVTETLHRYERNVPTSCVLSFFRLSTPCSSAAMAGCGAEMASVVGFMGGLSLSWDEGWRTGGRKDERVENMSQA